MLSQTHKENNLALCYCHLEVETFPASSRRRFLDVVLESAEYACVSLSDSQGSALQSWCYSTLQSKKINANRERALGGLLGICQAGLG